MTRSSPERVLRLALVGWGLGDLAMGRSRAGVAWLAFEALVLAAVAATTLLFADTTWYLVPYLLGMGFLATWAGQAVSVYRRARGRQGAVAPAQPRSPAAIVAWLALPLLAWGAGFWLVAADAASPAAVLNRFVTGWPDAERGDTDAYAGLTADPAMLDAEASAAVGRLRQLCIDGVLAADCGTATENLLRDVRVTITQRDDRHVVAEAALVEYQRRPSLVLGIFNGSEVVPVVVEPILNLELEARPASFGAQRWTIVNAEAG